MPRTKDPLSQVRELAEHTVQTYSTSAGSYVTGYAAMQDAKELLVWLAGVKVLTIWQCQECEELVDAIVGGRCPYEDCRGKVEVLTVIKEKRRGARHR